MKKYVITDIHEEDAYHDIKEIMMGKEIIPVNSVVWQPPVPFAGWSYGSFFVDNEFCIFLAIKYEEVKK